MNNTHRQLLEQAKTWIEDARAYTGCPAWSPSLTAEGDELLYRLNAHLSKPETAAQPDKCASEPVGPELPGHIPMRDAADYWRKAARGNWVLCNRLRAHLDKARAEEDAIANPNHDY